MKLNLKFLFISLFITSISIKANDTLKVQKVRFFLEPKIVANLHIPANKTTTTFGYDCDCGFIPTPGGYTEEKTISQNKPIFNLGLSAGLSVKLGKHFFYELSVSYYHYSLSSKTTTTSWYLSGNPYMSSNTYSSKTSYNYIGIGNGISYSYKRFSLTNTLLFYQYITYKESYVTNGQDSRGVFQQSDISSKNVVKDGLDILLMSEHKIGYSFFNNRIEPFIGVNFNWTSSFSTIKGNIKYFGTWLPFASVKINF